MALLHEYTNRLIHSEVIFCKAEIAYDGTAFAGWQWQDNATTVQQCLILTFNRIFSRSVKILGASRTDQGVHANGQVALITFDYFGLTLDRVVTLWNNALPNEIYISSFSHVSNNFHPHKNILFKTYTYDIATKKPHPRIARFVWHHPLASKISWQIFADTALVFKGHHDFHQFCKIKNESPKPTKRIIDEITFGNHPTEMSIKRLTFKAKGFLRFQIRRIVGACIEIGLTPQKFSITLIKKSLTGDKIVSKQIPTLCAKPNGLTLQQIAFKQ